MDSTPRSLLQQLRQPDQPRAWEQFVDLYTPLLLLWARRLGLQSDDAADLVQDVFVVLVKKLPEFQYDAEKKNFRGWLRTICFNKWRDRHRQRAAHVQQADEATLDDVPAPDEAEQFWQREHDAHLVQIALQQLDALRDEFEPRSLDVCREVVLKQRPIGDVARQFGITDNAVSIAKLRVLRRLRQRLADFLT